MRSSALAAALLALGACTAIPSPPPPTQPPAPAPRPAPTARPALPPPPASPPLPAEPTGWMDAPQSAGDWSYAGGSSRTVASFGRAGAVPDFTLTCDRSVRTVTMARAFAPAGQVLLRFLTETTTRMIEGHSLGTASAAAALQPGDPLLDAIAFSRGRFAVETAGMPTLYLPSWSEITRVVEDCR